MAIMWDAVVPPAELTAFARAVPVDQTYILDQLFPNVYDEVLEAEFGESVVTTRAAKARAWDAPPMPGRRDGFTTRKVKLPAVSQMLGKGERDRLELERQRSGGQSTSAIEAAVYDDTENNVRSVNARVEMMRGDLLSDGIITIPELGDLEADFGVPSEHKVAPAVPWSDHANSDVLSDMRPWAQTYRRNNGFGFGGMGMSEDVLYHVLQNQKIREQWAVYGNAPSVLTLEQLNQTLASNRLPQVTMTYDAQVVVDDTVIDILDPNVVFFTPPAGIRLGYTQWGITATALELRNARVQVEPSPAGLVAVIDKDVRPPYREEAYVDSAVMPILERPRGLFLATVLEADEDGE